MSQDTIDCRGLSCPLPVLKVKEALEKGKGEFSVLVDENICVENITRFLGYQGIPFSLTHSEEGSLIQVHRPTYNQSNQSLTEEVIPGASA